jgi:hypothetical protein
VAVCTDPLLVKEEVGPRGERRTVAVFLAALVASCLRGALPGG